MGWSRKWTRKDALAIVTANVKGSRVKYHNPLVVGEAVHWLLSEGGYIQAVLAKEVGLDSREMIRQFNRIYGLPEPVKRLVRQGLVLIDTAYRLTTIRGEEEQVKAGGAVAGLPSHVARQVIDLAKENPERAAEVGRAVGGLSPNDALMVIEYARRNPGRTAEECKKGVMGAKTVKEQYDMLVVPMDRADYEVLKSLARAKAVSAEELARKVVMEWIATNRRGS